MRRAMASTMAVARPGKERAMDDLAVFGANARQMRLARGWTQRELAAAR